MERSDNVVSWGFQSLVGSATQTPRIAQRWLRDSWASRMWQSDAQHHGSLDASARGIIEDRKFRQLEDSRSGPRYERGSESIGAESFARDSDLKGRRLVDVELQPDSSSSDESHDYAKTSTRSSAQGPSYTEKYRTSKSDRQMAHEAAQVSGRQELEQGQDVAFDRDFVVVEKRAVEVNALSDELGTQTRLSHLHATFDTIEAEVKTKQKKLLNELTSPTCDVKKMQYKADEVAQQVDKMFELRNDNFSSFGSEWANRLAESGDQQAKIMTTIQDLKTKQPKPPKRFKSVFKEPQRGEKERSQMGERKPG